MTGKGEMFNLLSKRVGEILKGRLDRSEKLKAVCNLLKNNVSYYDWVGFYVVDRKRENELLLGPFEGEPTQHMRIPFGRGICGQAAKLERTFVVQDISKKTNYLSCSANVKSEIVIPIFRRGKVVGELDIDSHTLSPFTEEDETFLNKIGEMASYLF